MDSSGQIKQTILKAIGSSMTGLQAVLHFACNEGLPVAADPVFLWTLLVAIIAFSFCFIS